MSSPKLEHKQDDSSWIPSFTCWGSTLSSPVWLSPHAISQASYPSLSCAITVCLWRSSFSHSASISFRYCRSSPPETIYVRGWEVSLRPYQSTIAHHDPLHLSSPIKCQRRDLHHRRRLSQFLWKQKQKSWWMEFLSQNHHTPTVKSKQ